MTWVGIIGVLVGLLTAAFAFVRPTRTSVAVFALAYIAHVASAVVYERYTQLAGGDATLYYYDPLNWNDRFGIELGTGLLIYVVQWMKSVLGGTYLDYFLVFQAFGFAGLALLMRTFQEITSELGVNEMGISYLLLFLPGFQFWTSMIGKDALLFLAVCLSIWGSMNISRRLVAIGAAIILMGLIRPHIAGAAAAAFAFTLFFDRRSNIVIRGGLLALAVAGVVYAISLVAITLRVDITNAESVSDFMATREYVTQVAGGTTAVTGGIPFKLFSLLARPLFVDAIGIFGLIASFENVALLLVYAYLIFNFRTVVKLARSINFIRYAIILSFVVTVMLTLTYYNIGLGLRQRTMMLPGILVTFVAVLAVRRARSHAALAVSAISHPPAAVQPYRSAGG